MKYITILTLFIGFHIIANTETDNEIFTRMLGSAIHSSNICLRTDGAFKNWKNLDIFIKIKKDLVPATTDLISVDHLIALGITKRGWQYRYNSIRARALQASVVNIMLRRFKNTNGFEYK